MGVRRLLVLLPIALAVAAIAHGVRFGDEHAFGEDYHDWLCSLLMLGLPALAWAFVARALAGLTTYGDGSVLADRLADLLPGRGRPAPLTAAIAACASAIYVGVERLEADGDTSYVAALLIIVVVSVCTTLALRRALGMLAGATLVFFRPRLASPPRSPRLRAQRSTRIRALPRHDWAAVRLGRAPPLTA